MMRQPRTPAEDVAHRLSVPLACGWKGCPKIFGMQSFLSGGAQKFDHDITLHTQAAGHRYRKLREVV